MPGLAGSQIARIGTRGNAGSPGIPDGLAIGRVRCGVECNLQEETMRIPMILATAILLTASAGAANAAPTMDMPFLVTASAVQDPPPPPAQPKGGDVKIDVDLDDDGTVWYTDPLWIVLGAAAIIVVVALIAVASRGGAGGTTIVK